MEDEAVPCESRYQEFWYLNGRLQNRTAGEERVEVPKGEQSSDSLNSRVGWGLGVVKLSGGSEFLLQGLEERRGGW